MQDRLTRSLNCFFLYVDPVYLFPLIVYLVYVCSLCYQAGPAVTDATKWRREILYSLAFRPKSICLFMFLCESVDLFLEAEVFSVRAGAK